MVRVCLPVQAGCGRTSTLFSFEIMGISPGIVTLAKSISGFGLPMGRILVKPQHNVIGPADHNGLGFPFASPFLNPALNTRSNTKTTLRNVYCIEGTGSITDIATWQTHPIEPRGMQAPDKHEDKPDCHILRATAQAVMACCVNPPVTGKEVHRADGSYATADVLNSARAGPVKHCWKPAKGPRLHKK